MNFLKEAEELRDNLIYWKSQFDVCAVNNWDNRGLKCVLEVGANKTKKEQLAKKIRGGCGKMCSLQNKVYRCGNKIEHAKFNKRIYCRHCQKALNICEEKQ